MRTSPMANLTLVQAINLALTRKWRSDDRVVILGEDVGLNGGVFRVTEGLQKRFGADRVVDTPLAESGIMGTAIGLAMAGMRPIPEIQFEGFLGPAYDQLVNHAARYRTRTRGAITDPAHRPRPRRRRHPRPRAPLRLARGHLRPHTPASRSSCPARPTTPRACSSPRSATPTRSIFFEPKRVYRSFREEVPEDEYTIPIGKAKVVAEGTDLTVDLLGRQRLPMPRSARQAPRGCLRRTDRPAHDLPARHRHDRRRASRRPAAA